MAVMLSRGSTGEEVAALQEKLASAGFPVKVDGVFGADTAHALAAFQKSANLRADAIYGDRTRGVLEPPLPRDNPSRAIQSVVAALSGGGGQGASAQMQLAPPAEAQVAQGPAPGIGSDPDRNQTLADMLPAINAAHFQNADRQALQQDREPTLGTGARVAPPAAMDLSTANSPFAAGFESYDPRNPPRMAPEYDPLTSVQVPPAGYPAAMSPAQFDDRWSPRAVAPQASMQQPGFVSRILSAINPIGTAQADEMPPAGNDLVVQRQKALALAAARARMKKVAQHHPSFEESQRLLAQQQPGSVTGAMSGGFLNGLPVVGPFVKGGAQNLAAGMRSLENGTPFGAEKSFVQGLDAADRRDHPVAETVGEIGGGIAGTIPMVAAAPAAFGAGGGSLLGRTLMAGAGGAVLGGADSAVRSGGDIGAIAKGAGLGGAFGGLGPIVGRAIGTLTRSAEPMLDDLTRGARNYLTKELGNPAKMAALQESLNKLGPDATLSDVSPEWMGVARGAASRPGSRDQIVTALTARDAGKNARLRTDLDTSLGQSPIPSRIEADLEQMRGRVAEGYREVFRDARAVDTQGLANDLDSLVTNLRGPAQKAVQQARGYLDIPGTDQLDPHPGALFETRQALDGLLTTEQNPKVIGQLTAIRRRVDETLAAAVPGIKDIDAPFSELMRQSEALQRGGMVFDSGKTATRPEELLQEMTMAARPQGAMVGPSGAPYRARQGARAEIDRLTGTKLNDPQALSSALKGEGDWNRDKLRILFGNNEADQALSAIDREMIFRNTHNRVTSGSDTAMASRFGDFLDQSARGPRVPMDATMTGIGLRGTQKVAQALLNGNAAAKAERFASELGGLSVARGDVRDEIVAALMRNKGRGMDVDPALQKIISSLLVGGAPAALR